MVVLLGSFWVVACGSRSPDPPAVAVDANAFAVPDVLSYELTSAPKRIVLAGTVSKNKTTDPRTLGGKHFLVNSSGHEYRVVSFDYALDTSALRRDEAAESDIGLTILPKDQEVALNSGQEVLMVHLYDAQPGAGDTTLSTIPQGGFSLPHGSKLGVASVTGIFPKAGGGAVQVGDSRLANGDFMAMHFKITLERADQVAAAAVSSYRSPYRDRSYVADPSRKTAPYTDFRNATRHVVKVSGLGVFLSNLTDSEPSTHAVEVDVNGVKAWSSALPAHSPGTSSSITETILPLSIALDPGAVVSVRGTVIPRRAIVFDFAGYLLADAGLVPVNEKLDILDVDLNGDGMPDIIDIDATGSVWVSVRVGDHLQDTEQEWARDLRNVDSLAVAPSWKGKDPPDLVATNSKGLCLDLKNGAASFRLYPSYCGGAPPDPADVWGDFNGDGWIDRMRIDPKANVYYLALGGPSGLGAESVAATGFGAVDRMFVSDSNGDGRSDIESEWNDAGGFECVIWQSTGTSFVKTPCKPQ